MEFAPVQIGLDIATSLAILASAITFLLNQRHKSEQSKKQSLDNSVRTVAVEKRQDALHVLSRKFINDVVGKLHDPSNVIDAGDLAAIQQRFERRNDLPADMLVRYESASAGISSFIDEVHAYKYQIYPLLDTLENGRDEIESFRKALTDLTKLFNDINRSAAPLAKELIRTVEFCKQHPAVRSGRGRTVPADADGGQHSERPRLRIRRELLHPRRARSRVMGCQRPGFARCADPGAAQLPGQCL